jgi:hypothetical protein
MLSLVSANIMEYTRKINCTLLQFVQVLCLFIQQVFALVWSRDAAVVKPCACSEALIRVEARFLFFELANPLIRMENCYSSD